MSIRDELAHDVMMGLALTKPLPHYTTDPGCPDDPPLEEPVLTAWRDITPFIDFLLERGWTKEEK